MIITLSISKKTLEIEQIHYKKSKRMPTYGILFSCIGDDTRKNARNNILHRHIVVL